MSKYKDCAIFVDANGRYCSTDKVLCVRPGECAQVTLINAADIPLLHYPSGDTDETSIVNQLLPEGLTVITEPGTYTLDVAALVETLVGTDAPEDPDEQVMICCRVYEKPGDVLAIQLLQTICDKLVSAEPTNIAAILIAIQELCDKILANQVSLAELVILLQGLCDKILAGNQTLILVAAELSALCEKVIATNATLNNLISIQTANFTAMLACMDQMKVNQLTMIEKLCKFLGDPNAPCPDCPTVEMTTKCDVSWFMTYTQAEFEITGLTIPGVDLTGKFTFPIDGNTLPGLRDFQETVVQCLEDAGYPVEVIQGRDGWTLIFNGPCPVVSTTGEGSIEPSCENCVPVSDLTGKTVVYQNSDDATELSISVGGNGAIKIISGSGDETDAEVIGCITDCLAAGHDVEISWATVDGGMGTATLLAGADTTAFPEFSNLSTNATGDSGKLTMLVVTCI